MGRAQREEMERGPKLYGGEQEGECGDQGKRGEGTERSAAGRGFQDNVEDSGNERDEDDVRQSGEDLEGHGEHAEHSPPGAGAGDEVVDNQHDERHPCERGDHGEVAAVDVEHEGSGKHGYRAGCECCGDILAAAPGPGEREHAEEEHVEGEVEADGFGHWQYEVDQVGRVKDGGLEVGEAGCAGEDVRIPDGDAAVAQLAEREGAAGVVILVDVAVG